MTKRKRKYNPLKRAIRLAQTAGKNYAVVWFAGTKEDNSRAMIWDLKHDGPVLYPTSDLIEVLFQYPYNWAVDLLTFGRTQQTKEEYCQVLSTIPVFVKHEQISKSVLAHMEKHIKSANPLQLVNRGWICNTTGNNLTDNEIQRIATYYDVWNFETILERDARLARE